MHLQREMCEVASDYGGAYFQFLTGWKCEGSVIDVQHAEDLEEDTFGKGTSGVADDAS